MLKPFIAAILLLPLSACGSSYNPEAEAFRSRIMPFCETSTSGGFRKCRAVMRVHYPNMNVPVIEVVGGIHDDGCVHRPGMDHLRSISFGRILEVRGLDTPEGKALLSQMGNSQAARI